VTTSWTMTVDCADPGRLAGFWALALGYVERPAPEGFDSWEDWLSHHGVPEDEWNGVAHLADPDGVLPSLSFLKVPEPKVAKNRLHIDVQVGGGRDAVAWDQRWPRVLAAVERLTAAGATVLAEVAEGDRPDHLVLADPEGNEFCVL
jgi:hypothetical protein